MRSKFLKHSKSSFKQNAKSGLLSQKHAESCQPVLWFLIYVISKSPHVHSGCSSKPISFLHPFIHLYVLPVENPRYVPPTPWIMQTTMPWPYPSPSLHYSSINPAQKCKCYTPIRFWSCITQPASQFLFFFAASASSKSSIIMRSVILLGSPVKLPIPPVAL